MNESREQKHLLTWVKIQYPNLLYTEDMGGIRLTIGQAVKAKKSRCREGHPDLMFQKLFLNNNKIAFTGLALEFKRTGEYVLKKNGDLKKNNHVKKQLAYLLELKKEGWFVCFAIGFEESKRIITTYLSQDIAQLRLLSLGLFPNPFS